MKKMTCIIISMSSDIGLAMARRWFEKGYEVYGTYRNDSENVQELKRMGANVIKCDIGCIDSINVASKAFKSVKWDILVLATGAQEPIGPFLRTNFDDWSRSISINFINQLRVVYELLPNRNITKKIEPCVLFFAGGGTNNATVNYSAYTVSKIALIKMCELLDAEIPDTRFVIVGPGWVKTKIHEATLKAKNEAGNNYQRTIDKLNSDECTPMENILNCCDWLIDSPREIVSGRNFSVVFDKWGSAELIDRLRTDKNVYKLRRYGNNIIVK